MNAKKCDHCNKFYDPYTYKTVILVSHEGFRTSKIGIEVTFRGVNEATGALTSQEKDLCLPCAMESLSLLLDKQERRVAKTADADAWPSHKVPR